jgi:hypothetical protein
MQTVQSRPKISHKMQNQVFTTELQARRNIVARGPINWVSLIGSWYVKRCKKTYADRSPTPRAKHTEIIQRASTRHIRTTLIHYGLRVKPERNVWVVLLWKMSLEHDISRSIQ